MEKILHAAVKSNIDGWIFFGKCHADCFHKAHNLKIKMSKKSHDQGFLTSEGRFVDRSLGAEIAINADQVRPDIVILFSEDLWDPRYSLGAKHTYDEIEGYQLLSESEHE